ncbi:MAG: tRNA-(ms[2]io[6]A)-hydroxylase [Bdellovibrionota bacterium]
MEDIADLLEFKLMEKTSPMWALKVMKNFDAFLLDHAAAEKKAMGTCLSFIAKYPDKPELVKTMFAIAKEELEHFEQVSEIIYKKGHVLKSDEKDLYIHDFLKVLRNGVRDRFLDRLLMAAIIENRGCERFALVSEVLDDGDPLKAYYEHLSIEEAKHYGQYIKLARCYFEEKEIRSRLIEMLKAEAEIVRKLPLTGLLH